MKACVEEKCDYVDISGEPQFLETMQLKYDQEAQDNGVHIVGSCAFDSIPADLGTKFARETFPGVFLYLKHSHCKHYQLLMSRQSNTGRELCHGVWGWQRLCRSLWYMAVSYPWLCSPERAY